MLSLFFAAYLAPSLLPDQAVKCSFFPGEMAAVSTWDNDPIDAIETIEEDSSWVSCILFFSLTTLETC